MKINKLASAQSKIRLELLQECAGTLRPVAASRNGLNESKNSVTQRRQALQAAGQQKLAGQTVTATLFNYQKALAAAERQAATLYRELQKSSGHKQELLAGLRQTVTGYQKLYREAANLQSAFGCTALNSGFNNIDYFTAKLRCGVEDAGEQELFAWLFSDLEAKLQALAELDFGGGKLPVALNNTDSAMYLLAADFLSIMSAYAQAVQMILEVAELWRQQYKEEEIVQALVRASLKLAQAGAMEPVEAAGVLAAVLRQYAVELPSAAAAAQACTEVIDIWTKLAADYGIGIKALAEANEQTAGAAYRSGIDFSCLQALLAGLLNSSKLKGELAGRYLRSLLLWLNTDAATRQLTELGIERYGFTEQGGRQWRRLQEVILEAASRSGTAPNMEVLLNNIAYGKFNIADLGALSGGYAALQQKLQAASSAQGCASAQYRKNSLKMEQNLFALQRQADDLLKNLQQSDTAAEPELITLLAELVTGLKNLQPEFMAAFQGSRELLFLFRTILTVAEAALAQGKQGISMAVGLQAVQAGRARGSIWR